MKGNFQGCPLSPLFFVLGIEILASRIRNNKEIVGVSYENLCKKINLVADDILLIFKNSLQSRNQVEEELKEFSHNSGLTVNKDKCTVTHICKDSYDIDHEIFPAFQRKKQGLSYIGLNCTFDQEKLWNENIPSKIDRLTADIHTCSDWSESTTLGRITVLKLLFFSRFPYFFELVTQPRTLDRGLKQFQSTLDNIVWNGKKPKLKLQNAVPRPFKGGLGMINVTHHYCAIKIDLLRQAVDTTHLQFWQAHLFSHFSVQFDEVLTCNLTYKSM